MNQRARRARTLRRARQARRDRRARRDRESSRIWWLLVLGTFASILVCALLSEPVYRYVGPWLAERSTSEQVLVGVAAGAGAFVPLLPLVVAAGGLRRRLAAPAVWLTLTGWVFVTAVGLPGRGLGEPSTHAYRVAVFRSEAGWAWPTAAVVATAMLLGALALLAAHGRSRRRVER